MWKDLWNKNSHSFFSFGSANNARFYFNTGSDFRMSLAITGQSGSKSNTWASILSTMGTVTFNYNTTTHLMLVGMREFNNPLLSYFFGIDASLKPFYPILIFLVFIHLSKWIVLGFKKRSF